MRKLVFAALAGVFMLSSGFATLGYEPKPLDEIALEKTTDDLESYLEFKVLTNDVNSKDDVPCAWRTCYYRDGVKVRCGEWTFGDCSVNEDGSLQPGPVQLPSLILQG